MKTPTYCNQAAMQFTLPGLNSVKGIVGSGLVSAWLFTQNIYLGNQPRQRLFMKKFWAEVEIAREDITRVLYFSGIRLIPSQKY